MWFLLSENKISYRQTYLCIQQIGQGNNGNFVYYIEQLLHSSFAPLHYSSVLNLGGTDSSFNSFGCLLLISIYSNCHKTFVSSSKGLIKQVIYIYGGRKIYEKLFYFIISNAMLMKLRYNCISVVGRNDLLNVDNTKI